MNRVKELAVQISLHKGKFLTRSQKGRIDDEESRLDFRVKELLKESEERQSKLAEDITKKGDELRIKSMEEVLRIINET